MFDQHPERQAGTHLPSSWPEQSEVQPSPLSDTQTISHFNEVPIIMDRLDLETEANRTQHRELCTTTEDLQYRPMVFHSVSDLKQRSDCRMVFDSVPSKNEWR